MKHQILDKIYQFICNLLVAVIPVIVYYILYEAGVSAPVIIATVLIICLLLAVIAIWNFDRASDMSHFMDDFHIYRLLQGRSILERSDNANQIFDIGLECTTYVVLLVQHVKETKEKNVSRRMKGPPNNAVVDCLNSILLESYQPHFTTINLAETAIVGLPELDKTEDPALVYACLQRLKDCLQEGHDRLCDQEIDTRIAVSTIRRSLQEAGAAYQETLEMIEYAVFCESTDAVIASEESISPEENNCYLQETAELERKFFVAATNYQFSSACEYMLEMLEHYSRHRYESVHTIKARFYGRIETVYNLIEMKLNPDETISSFRQEFYDEFMRLTTKQQIADKIRMFFSMLDTNLTDSVAHSSGDHVANAVSYIERFYADPNLSVAMVADALQINSSYLSRVFKQYKEYGILEFIHHYRIEKVKQLLVSSNLDLQQIAVQTGYENAKAMGRVFKKYTGITPSAYREANGGALADNIQ